MFLLYSCSNHCLQHQVNVNKNQAETLFSQFVNTEFAESQNKILTQQAPQQFISVPNNPQTQNLVNSISSSKLNPKYNNKRSVLCLKSRTGN